MKHSGVGAFFFSCQFPSLMCLAFHIPNRPLCGHAADVSARICKNQHRLLCLLPPTAFGDFVIGCIFWLYGSGSTASTRVKTKMEMNPRPKHAAPKQRCSQQVTSPQLRNKRLAPSPAHLHRSKIGPEMANGKTKLDQC